MTRYRCASDARDRDEARYGTASLVRRWILLEQPGPWGRDAVLESRLPASVAAELTTVAEQVNARIILIRRAGGAVASHRRCFVVRSEQALTEELVLDDVADLLDVDLSPLATHQPVGGEPVEEPLYLVCTNGRHDACCAEFGQPLARALADAAKDRTWECSHIGGDRFAGNLVCFPHGLYYGHVAAEDGPRVAELYERGMVDLGHYRGRSCHPFVVQAAEYFLRVERDLHGVEALSYTRRRAITEDAFRVDFEGVDASHFTVDVRVTRDPEPRLLTCQATAAARPPRYELLAITGEASDSRSGGSSSSTSPSRPRR